MVAIKKIKLKEIEHLMLNLDFTLFLHFYASVRNTSVRNSRSFNYMKQTGLYFFLSNAKLWHQTFKINPNIITYLYLIIICSIFLMI